MTERLVVVALAFTASTATPGPDAATIFSKALARGGWGAAPFTLGVVLGKLVLLSFAVFGLAAVAEALGPALRRRQARWGRLPRLYGAEALAKSAACAGLAA